MSVIDWSDNRMSVDEHRADLRQRMELMRQQHMEDERQELIELTNKPEPCYLILQGETPSFLQEKVNYLLSLGWNLNGGVSMTSTKSYMQAMSKPAGELKVNNHFGSVEFTL